MTFQTMKQRWIFRIYNGLLLLVLPFVVLWVLARWRRRLVKGFERWDERWGHIDPSVRALFSGGKWWWIHAVSLGEVKAIETFLRRAPQAASVRLLLSAVTPEALSWAVENRIAEVVIAAPIDLPWVVRRVFRDVRPEFFISVEAEFWPNLLREARRSKARVALINGRLSAKSYRSYRFFRYVLQPLWECLDLAAVRQEEDAGRFIDLGVVPEHVRVAGNLKYDLPLPARRPRVASADGAGIVLAVGSSREGDEALLLPVIERVRAACEHVTVIWAPRHLERIPEIETLFTETGVAFNRKSAGDKAPHLLWDSMGDLLDAYGQADIAIMGGSFVTKGGQNPIEPAALGIPVVLGPSMENFKGISEVLVREGGARQVTLDSLERCLLELVQNPEARKTMGERARVAVERGQGATDRTLEMLLQLR